MIWAFNTSVLPLFDAYDYMHYPTSLQFIIQFLGRKIKTSAVRNISSKDSHNTFSSKMKMTFCNKDYWERDIHMKPTHYFDTQEYEQKYSFLSRLIYFYSQNVVSTLHPYWSCCSICLYGTTGILKTWFRYISLDI